MEFLKQLPRVLFFTGKGGVGKTSTACATALHQAAAGEKVLLANEEATAGFDRVVFDTGHTILLLDAAQSYHKEVLKRGDAHSEEVTGLLPRLRDPSFTRLLICTLPEATPMHEAADLQEDLARAEIKPAGWVVNQSLTPLSVTDPLLAARRGRETRYLQEIVEQHSDRMFILPWQEQGL